MDFGVRGIGGEIELFPPPVYRGELEKWEDSSWQLKRYVGLYKPVAKHLMDDVATVRNGDLCRKSCAIGERPTRHGLQTTRMLAHALLSKTKPRPNNHPNNMRPYNWRSYNTSISCIPRQPLRQEQKATQKLTPRSKTHPVPTKLAPTPQHSC